jgi:hypothetical protein
VKPAFMKTAHDVPVRRSIASLALAAAGVAAIAGCGAARASSVSRETPTPSQVAVIDHLTAVARHQYQAEITGSHAIQTLHSVGRDPTLLRLLAVHDLGGARTYISNEFRRVWYHWHVSRMRVSQASTKVSEVGVPFVIPASHMTLRYGRRDVGTLSVSMQDEIGMVRLLHRWYPKLQILIRGSRGELRTSFHSAALVRLPASGTVRVEGVRYLVRSFREPAWGGETVTIWLLVHG